MFIQFSAIAHSHLNPSSTPNPPFKFKAKHTSKLSEVFTELLQTVFHESQAMSYFCLHAISSLNTNPGPISNPNIPPTPSFLLQPIFYLPCICSCKPIPLLLPILCIYLHIVWISASTITCTEKQINSSIKQKDLSSICLSIVWSKAVLALWGNRNNSINCLRI